MLELKYNKGCVNLKKIFNCILVVVIGVIFSPTIINAESISIQGTPNNNSVVYTIKYTKSESDIDVDNIHFTINNSNENITVTSKSNVTNGTCNETECTIPVSQIEALGVPVDVATVTLVNNTEVDVVNDTLTISINGNEVKKEGINLSAGKTTTTTQQRVLNSDPSLSDIKISVGTFDQNFDKDNITYNITGIKDTINSITITPICDNNCETTIICPNGECTVSNNKKISLQVGANRVLIISESEDGYNHKQYTLNIYRGEIESASAYLSTLEIVGAKLSPNFDSLTNDYTATISTTDNSLDIVTVAEDPKANIVVKGNNNLKEGENTITITVTSSDSKNKQVYTILVNKELPDMVENATEEENIIETNKVEKKKNNVLLIVILSVIGLGLIILAYFIIFKRRKNKKDKNKDNNNNNNNFKSEDKIEKNDINTENNVAEDINLEKEEQNIDEALDDLMKTKKLELGDLDF